MNGYLTPTIDDVFQFHEKIRCTINNQSKTAALVGAWPALGSQAWQKLHQMGCARHLRYTCQGYTATALTARYRTPQSSAQVIRDDLPQSDRFGYNAGLENPAA